MARRRYQRGSLEVRGGFWVGRWREDVQLPDGRVVRRNRQQKLGTKAEFPTKRLARRALDALLAEINAPGYVPRSALPLNAIIDRWESLVLSSMRRSTWTSLRPQIAKHVRPFLGTKLLSDITPEVVEEWLASRAVSAQTKRGLMTTLGSIWRKAREWGYTSAPCPRIKIVGPPARRGRAFKRQEVQRILEAAEEPWRTLFQLLAETGVRAGEAFGLRWEDVDWSTGTILVDSSAIRGVEGPTKNGRSRYVQVSDGLLSALRAHGAGPGKLLFPSRAGTPLRPDRVVGKHLRPLLRRLGIRHAGLHAFRHANATELLRAGVPLRTVSARLGHSDPAITLRIYSHVIEEDSGRAAAIAGTIFAASCVRDADDASEVIENNWFMIPGAGGGNRTPMELSSGRF